MRSSLAGLLAAGLVFGASSTPAPAVDAEQLRGKIEEVFALTGAAGGAAGSAPYAYEAVEVAPRGEGFRVTVSGLRILLDPADAGLLDIGDAAFTMTPAGRRGGEALFQVSDLSVPPRWRYAEGGEAPSHVITPGPLSFEGLWSFAYLSMMEARFSAAGARVETPAGGLLSSFETIRGELESRPADKGRYDVGGKLRIDGVAIRDDGFHVDLGGIESEIEVPGHDPAAAAEVLRAAARAEAPSPDATEAASTSLLADLLYLSQGGRMSVELRDFRGLWDGTEEVLEIDGIELDYAVSNLEGSVAKLDMALAQTGLRITGTDRPAGRLAAALLPADSTAVLSLERLPLRTLLALIEPLAEEAPVVEVPGVEVPGVEVPGVEAPAAEDGSGDPGPLGGQDGDRLAAEAGERLIGAMSEAGTTLDLSGTRLAAPEAEVALKGGMVVDANAAFGMRGTLLAEVGGFDTLVELARQSLENPDPRIQGNARGVVAVIAVLQALAERDETATNGPVDRFLFKVEPNGAVWVNDKPLLPPQTSH